MMMMMIIIKIKKLYNGNSAHVKCENKSDTSNYRSSWKLLRITQTIPEKHAGKTRN